MSRLPAQVEGTASEGEGERKDGWVPRRGRSTGWAREEGQGAEELMGIFTEVKSDGAKGTKRR